MTSLRVFIGYDPRQPVAAQVLAHSIWKHTTIPTSVTRLILSQLPITRKGLTDFTFSRFLVPYLSSFEGTSIFLDSDILCRHDLSELLAYPLAYPDCAVFMVKHQQLYEWPSVMVFNNALCKKLTPEFIESSANGLYGMGWADRVGTLPKEWNHLVGYDASNPLAHLVHFTMGVPVWPETSQCEFAQEWHAAFRETISTVSFEELMGKSVHVPHLSKLQGQA